MIALMKCPNAHTAFVHLAGASPSKPLQLRTYEDKTGFAAKMHYPRHGIVWHISPIFSTTVISKFPPVDKRNFYWKKGIFSLQSPIKGKKGAHATHSTGHGQVVNIICGQVEYVSLHIV